MDELSEALTLGSQVHQLREIKIGWRKEWALEAWSLELSSGSKWGTVT